MTKRVLVVGGGIGGTMTANSLVARLYPEILDGEVEITMISNSPCHEYKPANMYVAFSFSGSGRREAGSGLYS